MADKAITVVLPVYNAEKDIERTFAAVHDYAVQHEDVKFLFVDDGSCDNTADRIDAMLATHITPYANIHLLRMPTNQGKGGAVKAGVMQADTPFVMFMDGDLAYPLEHVARVREGLLEHDVVIGSRWLIDNREGNKRSFVRRTMGESFNLLARVMCGLSYPDTQAGLKGFRFEAAQAIFQRQRLSRYAFDVELLFLAHRLGYRVGEIPAHVDSYHATQASSMNLIQDSLKMFSDLVRIRMHSLCGRYE